MDPAAVQANLLLGNCLQRLGRADEAEDLYMRAYQTNPNELAVSMALADLKMSQGEVGEASARLGYVLLVDADHAEAHRKMSEVQEQLGDLESAAYHLWRARDLDDSRTSEERSLDRARLLSIYGELTELESDAP
jgi:tetratricopeptide (TPR) repeat protein